MAKRTKRTADADAPELAKSDLSLWLEAEFAPAFSEGDTVWSVMDEREVVVRKIERLHHIVEEDAWHVTVDLGDGFEASRSSRVLLLAKPEDPEPIDDDAARAAGVL